MPHAREQLRAAVVTTLTGLTTTGARVTASRVYPHDDAALPSLVVYTPGESLMEGDIPTGDPLELRALTLNIEGRAKAAAGIDDTLDDISAEVETAMYADQTLGGLAKTLELKSVATTFTGESDQPVGLIELVFEIVYRVDARNPLVIIE